MDQSTRSRTARLAFVVASLGLLIGLLPLVVGTLRPARANTLTFPVVESFAGPSTNNRWRFSGTGALTNEADGWLRLTPANFNQRGSAVLLDTVSTTDGVQIDFEYATYGTINFEADGIAMFLTDGSVAESNVNIGAWGGCLGYSGFPGSPDSGCNSSMGVRGGYVAVGIDEYGNFAAAGAGRPGTGLLPGITVIGSGNGPSVNYRSTGQLPGEYNRLLNVPIPGGVSTGSRANARHVRMVIARGKLSLWHGTSQSTLTRYVTEFDIANAAGQVALPSTVRLGFTSATGGGTNIHEIRNLRINRPIVLAELSKTTTLPSGFTELTPGQQATYTIRATVDPASPNPIVAGRLQDTVPAALTDVTWTCGSTNGATCQTASGSGNAIDVRVDANLGQTVELRITGTVANDPAIDGMTVQNTVVFVPQSGYDANLTAANANPTFTVRTRSNLTATTVGTATLTPGSGGSVPINLVNTSAIADPNISVNVELPADVLADTTALPAGCALPDPANPRTVACTGLPVAGNSTYTVDLPLWADSAANPSPLAKAAATATVTVTGSRFTGSLTRTGSVIVGPARFKLVLEPTTNATVIPGGAGELALTLRNLGPSDAYGPATISYTPPDGTLLAAPPTVPEGVTCSTTAPSTTNTWAPVAEGGVYPTASPLTCAVSTTATARLRSPSALPATAASLAGVTGIMAWYDGADPTSITVDGGGITQWRDRSGNDRHLAQATVANRPSPLTAAANGRAAVRFGADDTMASGAFTVGQTSTVFAVVRPNVLDGTRNRDFVTTGGSSNAEGHILFQESSDPTGLRVFAGNGGNGFGVGGVLSVGQWALLGAVTDGANSQLRVNGAVAGTGNAGTQSWINGIRLGRSAVAGSWFVDADYAEVIVVAGAASTADRERIEGYLAAKWGIALPSAHPWAASLGQPTATLRLPVDILGNAGSNQETATGLMAVTAANENLASGGTTIHDDWRQSVSVIQRSPRWIATASSVDSTTPTAVPMLAIDRSGAGRMTDRTTFRSNTQQSPWWQLDLGESTRIGGLRLWGSLDNPGESSNLTVYASDVPLLNPPYLTPGVSAYRLTGSTGRVGELTIKRNARYLMIRRNDVGRLSLAEVQVLRPFDLVDTTTAVATASSEQSAATGASEAIDGTRFGFAGSADLFVSASGATPWWQVELARREAIGTIRLWGRTDGFGEQTANLEVHVSDNGTEWGATPVATYSGNVDRLVELPVNTAGRYVRIRRTDTGVLALAEVQLTRAGDVPLRTTANRVGGPAPAPLATTGWVATQTSVEGGTATADKAIDGNTDGRLSSGSLARTAADTAGAYWQVDMAATRAVGTVRIWNRSDVGGMLRDVRVYVSNSLLGSDPDSQDGVWTTTIQSTPGDYWEVPVFRNARYIRIRNATGRPLQLAEVQVTDGTGFAIDIPTTPGNRPPVVALTSPTTGQTVSIAGGVSLIATAADPDNGGSIERVEFFSGTTLLGVLTSPPYALPLTTITPGTYTVTVVAVDDVGATGSSAPVTFNVIDNFAPSVSITTPSNGQMVTGPTVVVRANASDVDGNISRVDFFEGTTLLGSATTAPWQIAWGPVASGSRTVTAVAYDNLGRSTTSTPVTFVVNLPPTVTLTSPAAGTWFNTRDVTLAATATDADGSITQVQFMEGTTVIATVTTAPYQFTWTGIPYGTRTVFARAVDDRGAFTDSQTVTFYINTPPQVAMTGPGYAGAVNADLPVSYYRLNDSATGLPTGASPAPTELTGVTTALWLDAADAATVSVSDGMVTQWRDRSGNGRHVSQAVGTARPVYSTDALNGRAVVRFDGTDDVLRATGTGLNLDDFAVFAVVTASSNAGSCRSWLSARNTGNDFTEGVVVGMRSGSSSSWESINLESGKGGGSGCVDYMTSDVAFGTAAVMAINAMDPAQPTQSRIYVNGALEGSRSASTATTRWNEIRVGARFFSNIEQGYLHGTIAELIVTPASVGTADRQRIEGYLARKWGVALAPGHPHVQAGSIAQDAGSSRSDARWLAGNRIVGAVQGDGAVGTLVQPGANPRATAQNYAGSALDRSDQVSVSGWINPQIPGQNGGIVDKTIGGGTNRQYQLFLEGGRLVWRLRNASELRSFYSNTYPVVGRWTHVAGTWDGTTIRMYVDGVEIGSQAFTGPLLTGEGTVNLGWLGGTYQFQGAIDDLAVFPTGLSAAQIQAQAQAATGAAYADAVLAAGPVGFWRFEETTGSLAQDSSAGGFPAVVTSGAYTPGARPGSQGRGAPVQVGNPDLRAPSAAGSGPDARAQVSLEAWINPTVPGQNSGIVERLPNGSCNQQYSLILNGGSLDFRIRTATGAFTSVNTGVQPTVGTWSHVVATYDGAVLRVYVNGVALSATATLAGPLNGGAGEVRLGTHCGAYGFQGALDEIAVYAAALTPARVRAHYEAGLADQAAYNGGGVTLTANALDVDGSIARVEFWEGTTKLASTTTSPYRWRWDNPPMGTRTVFARAVDDRGLVTDSTPLVFLVNNAPTVTMTGPRLSVADGSFEQGSAGLGRTGTVGGWTVAAGDIDVATGPTTAHDGSTFVDLNGAGPGTIRQTLQTVTGASYQISWVDRASPAAGAPTPYTVRWNGTELTSFTATDGPWTTRTAMLVATGTSGVLEFASTHPGDSGALLDAVTTGPASFGSGSVVLSATAADSDGSIARVEFWSAETLIGTAYAAPWTLPWVAPGSGPKTVFARAIDDSGLKADSAPLSFTVNDGPSVVVTSPTANSYRTTSSITATGAVDLAAQRDAHWRLDETSGTTAANSAGNAAALAIGSGATWVAGRVGGALRLDGATSSIVVPSLTGNGDLTVSGWVRLETGALDGQVLWSFQDTTGAGTLAVEAQPSTGRLGLRAPGAASTAWTTRRDLGVGWHHLTLVRSGTTYRLLVDGLVEIDGAGPGTTAPTYPSFTLGARRDGGTVSARAAVTLDELQVHWRALSGDEARALAGNPVVVELTAAATDLDGSVTRVEFAIDGALVAVDTEAPYRALFPALGVGRHTVTATAHDSSGQRTTSVPVGFDVGTDPATTYRLTTRYAAPAPTTPGSVPMSLWLDAGSDASVVRDCSRIDVWRDLSGNGNHLTPVTIPGTAFRQTTALNNLPAAVFDGQAVLRTTRQFNPTGTTVFAVARYTTSSGGRVVGGFGNNWLLGWWGNSLDRAHFDGWVTNSSMASTTAAQLYSATTGNGQGSLWRNGALVRSATGGFTSPNGLVVGGWGSGSEMSASAVSEVLVSDRVLTVAERQATEAYLGAKWGLTVTGGATAERAATPALWVDASDASSFSYSCAVSSWQDRSGNGNHATQANLAQQPNLDPTGFSGQPAVRFSGRNLQIPTAAAPGPNSAVFAVMQSTTNGNDSTGLINAWSLTDTWRPLLRIGLSNLQYHYWNGDWALNGSNTGALTPSLQAMTLTTSSGATTVTAWRSGLAVGSGTRASDWRPYTDFRLGSFTGYGTRDGVIAEMIVTSTTPTVAEQQRIEGYLAAKWGLRDQLPAGHPFGTTQRASLALDVGAGDAPAGTAASVQSWDDNRLAWSEQIDQATWTRSNLTVQPNVASGPTGAPTAERLVESAGTTTRQITQPIRLEAASTGTFSVHLKAVGGLTAPRRVNLRPVDITTSGSNRGVVFDLTTGTVVGLTGTLGPDPVHSVTALADGWYRVTVTVTSTDGAFQNVIALADTTSATTYAGDGASGVLVWGAQLSVRPGVTAYQPTEAAGVVLAGQQWRLAPLPGGRVRLTSATSGRSLATGGAGNLAPTVLAETAAGDTSQAWDARINTDGTLTFVGAANARALGITDLAPGTPVTVADADGSAGQRWELTAVARSGYDATVVGTGPIAYFRLGDRTGTNAADTVGRGATGTYVGSPTLGVTGAIASDADTAVGFAGTDHLDLTVPGVPTGAGTKTTVSLWFRRTDTTPGTVLGVGGHQVVLTAGGCLGFSDAAGGCRGVAADPTWVGRWVQLTVELDATNPSANRLWLDGAAQTLTQREGSAGAATTATAVRIAGAVGSVGGRFVGTVDEVAVYDRALSEADRAGLASGSPFRTAPTLWLDAADAASVTSNGSAVVSWNDKSGNGNDVSISRVTYQPTAMNGSPAVVTDGATVLETNRNFQQPSGTASVPVAAGTALDLTSQVTVSAWIRPAFGGQNGGIVDKTVDGATNTHYQLFLEGGQLVWRLGLPGGGYRDLRTGYYPSAGSWVHVAGTWDGAVMRTYLNGTPIGGEVGMTSIRSGNGPLLLGTLGSNVYRFTGTIDEPAVFPTALGAERLTFHAQAASRTAYQAAVLADGPVGYWGFDELNGTIVDDSSPTVATGALTSGERTAGVWGDSRGLGGGGNTVFVVGRAAGPMGRLIGADNNWLFGWHGGCEDRFHFDGWAYVPCPGPTTTPRLYSGTMGNGQATLWRDGTQLASVTGGYTGPNGLAVGGAGWGSETSTGAVSEVLVYDRVLTDAERRATEAYLAAKWNLTVAGGATASMATNPALWLDAADAPTVARTNDRVTAWADKSGNGNHLFPLLSTTAATRQSALNGLPALVTTGTGVLATVKAFTPSRATVFVVGAQRIGSANQRVVAGLNNNWTLGWLQGTEDRGLFGNPLRTTAQPTSNDAIVYSATVDTGQASLWRNGTLLGAQTGSFLAPDGLQVGGGLAGGERSVAAVGEVIVYDRLLDDGERRQIEAYLLAKWRVAAGAGTQTPTGPAAWYDASDGTTVVRGENGTVVAVRDRSGYTNALVGQTPAASASTYLDQAGLNGRPAVMTTGGTPLATTTAFNPTGTTVFAVARMTGTQNSRLLSGVRNNWLLGWHAGCADVAHLDGWVGSSCTTGATTAASLYSTTSGNGQASLWRNGSLIASAGGGFTSPNGFQIGGDVFRWGRERSDGAVSEVLVYNRVLTPAERAATEAYLGAKWGLSVTGGATPSMATAPALWVDAADAASVERNAGGTVSRWVDKSGNANHLTPVTPPTTRSATALNGRAGIVTGGANILGTTRTFNPAGATVLVVAAPPTGDYSAPNRGRLISGVHNDWLLGTHDACTDRAHFDGWLYSACAGLPTTPVPRLWSSTSGNGQGSMWLNGTLLNAAPGGFSAPNGLAIGGRPGTEQRVDGTVGEILVYDRVLTEAERASTEAYLGAKWGLTVAGGATASMATAPALWVDATEAATVVETAGTVTAWRDRSGNGNDLVPLDASYDPAGVNDRPAVTTTGREVLLSTPTSHAQGTTVFAVARQSGNRSARLVTAGHNDWFLGWHGGCEDRAHYERWLISSCPVASTQTILYSTTTGNGQASLWRNGAPIASATGPFTSPNGIAFGGQGGERSAGSVAEVVVFPRILPDLERRQIEATLVAKWGIGAATSSSGPATWLDAADPGTVELDADGVVTRWRDRTGNGGDVVSTAPVSTVRLEPAALNGLPAVTFDGRSLLATPRRFNPTGATVFAVARWTGTANNRVIASVYNNWLLGWHGGHFDRAHFDGWLSVPGPGGTTNALLYSSTSGNGQGSVWRNGNLLASAPGGFTTPNGLAVGGWGSGSEMSGAAVSEVLVYDRVLTTAERQATETYLGTKWGVSVTTGVTPSMATAPALWVDATDAATVQLNTSGTVKRWADKSGNGNHLDSANTTRYDTAGLNGLPAVRTNGINGLRSSKAFANGGTTVLAVARMVSNSPAGSIVAGSNWILGWHAGNEDRILANNNWVACCGRAAGTQAVLYGLSSGNGRATAYKNGSLLGSATASFFSGISGLVIGGRDGSEWANGAVSEVIVYNRILPDDERRSIELYLANKWGVTLAAPEPPSPYAATVASVSGAQAYWRLGESDATTSARDASGWLRHGAYHADVLRGIPSAVTGEADTAARFGATGSGVQMGDLFDMTGTQPFSVAFWTRVPSTIPQGARIISKEDEDATPLRRGWGVRVDTSASQLRFERWNGASADTAGAVIPFNTWVHVVASYDGATIRLSVNGTLADSAPANQPLPDTGKPLTLGRNASGDWGHFAGGDLDEVVVWTRALSELEIGRLASAAPPAAPTTLAAAPADGRATVSWTAPTATGAGPILATTVAAVPTPGLGLPTVRCTAPGATTSCTLEGLVNGAAYTVSAAARNVVGTGPSSTPITVRTAPTDVLSGSRLALWLDGADPTTLFADTAGTVPAALTADVARWADKSPRANHATQAVPGSRATVTTLGGLAAASFDGVTDAYVLDIAKLPTGTQPSTVFAVAVQESNTPAGDGTRTVLSWGATGNGQSRSLVKGAGSAYAYLDTGGTTFAMPATAQWPIGEPVVVDGDVSADSSRLRMSGSLSYQSATLANSTGATAAALGGSPFQSGLNWKGRIAEVIVLEGGATVGEVAAVETYLARKWGLPISNGALRNGSSPAALYPLGEAVGSSVAADVSRNGRNGTYESGATLGVPGPRTGSSAVRSGATGIANVSAVPATTVTRDRSFTLASWYRNPTGGNHETVISNYNGTGVILSVTGDRRSVYFDLIQTWPSDAIEVYAANVLTPGRWHHLAATYDGSGSASGVTLYVDGNPVTHVVNYPTVSGSAQSSSPMLIGRRPDNWSCCNTTMELAEVGVFDRQLSRDEIRAFASNAADTGNWTPTWTPAGLTTALWLDAADPNALTLNGSGVSQWWDKSGNNRHAVQTGATAQPTRVVSGQAGRSVLAFDGNDGLLIPTSQLNLTQTYERFIAGRFQTKTNSSVVFDSNNTWAGSGFYNGEGGTAGRWADYAPNGAAGATADFFPHVFWSRLNGASSLQAVDGATPASIGNPGTNGLQGATVGHVRGMAWSQYGFVGEIYEVIVVPGTLGDADRRRIEGYLAWKWGLQTSLPPDHPFRQVPPT